MQGAAPTLSKNRLGFLYAWSNSYSDDLATRDRVTDLTFPKKPEGYKPPKQLPEIVGYIPVILKGKVKFGCKEVSNALIRELVAELKD